MDAFWKWSSLKSYYHSFVTEKKKAENIQLKHLAHAEDKIQSNKFYLFSFLAHLIIFQNGSKRIKDTF